MVTASPNFDFCSSDTASFRSVCLRKAAEELEKENVSSSAFYQVQAICAGARGKYFSKQIGDISHLVNWNACQKHLSQNVQNSSELRNFFEKSRKLSESISADADEIGRICEHISIESPETGVSRLIHACNQFPDEWTIIQLCKSFDADNTISLESEILIRKLPIYLTILRHPRSNLFPQLITIKLNFKEELGFVLDNFFYISKQIREICSFEGKDDANGRATFWKGIENLEERLKAAIGDLKNLLGPWKCFFAGNTCKDDKDLQNILFDLVDEFAFKHKLDSKLTVILSMLARQITTLTEADINTASSYLEEETKFKLPKNIVHKFLVDLKKYSGFKKVFLPCILIIDEALDHIFWEMVNPMQEICRISSFYILNKLFQKYKARIREGYIQMSVKTGNCIINPDNSLVKMQNRMSSFFSYWLPDWNCIIGEAPSTKSMLSLLSSGDAFIYCGHGSGLQYINGYKITKLNIESVIFLFGCDSVKLKSEGLHSEMIGSHIYYHAALSPAVIGCLFVAFDFQLDSLSTNILSMWLRSEKAVHWKNIEKSSWKRGEITSVMGTGSGICSAYEPRLSLILSNIRADESEKIYNRILLVYRGLPVWNVFN